MNVIDEAMGVIEAEGWFPGPEAPLTSPSPHHRHCIVTAIQAATEDEELRKRAWVAVAEEIGVPHHHPFLAWLGVVQFNDSAETSLEDVMLAMKRASARLDSVD